MIEGKNSGLKIIEREETEYGNICIGGIFKYNDIYYVVSCCNSYFGYPAIALIGDTRGDLLFLDDNEMVRRCSLE